MWVAMLKVVFKKWKDKVKFGEVDFDQNSRVCRIDNVFVFPTVMLIKDERVIYYYNAERRAQTFPGRANGVSQYDSAKDAKMLDLFLEECVIVTENCTHFLGKLIIANHLL